MPHHSRSPDEGRRRRENERPRRSICDPNNPFQALTANEFLEKFRISKSTAVIVLCHLESSDLTDDEFPLHLQLLSTLAYYGTGQCASAEAILGVSGTAVKLLIGEVSKGICRQMKNRYLFFPNHQELAAFQTEFNNIVQIPNVIGCLSSIYVPVRVRLGREMGVNNIYYGDQFMKVLVVCGPQGQITHIIAQTYDAFHDWEIFCDSMLLTRLTTGEYGDVVLIVDETYPTHPYLLRPVDSPTFPSDDQFNISHFIVRYLTHQKFQVIMTRFPCLTCGMEPLYPTNLDIVLACAVLHNVCLRCGTPLPSPREPSMTQNEEQDQRHFYTHVMEE
ncbi:putative nuclease HARBI1 [Panulirus ornatus]|uniref:putative nuclease HARBI1 n=1 Tax=Panulirus ornatus TaxID=150431 RepID=UPI003A8B70D7